MSKIKDLFISSSKEFKNLRNVIVMAMFGAISIVLGIYLTIMPTETIKISFTFLPNEFVYYLFGPVAGAFFGAAMDILTFLVRPAGPFFYGFTITAILTGLFYGIAFYKKPLSLKRIIIAKVIYTLTIDLILNTYWLTLLYGSGFMAILPMRIVKAAIMLPVQTILLYTLIRGVEATGILKLLNRKNA
ncbi:MAG TPA: folate family ECF transporter S component [Mobilitalea sp.]|nr:folate family ECF transporter S component [Mobilitalea sp.]